MPTIEERLEAINRTLELSAAILADTKKMADEAIERDKKSIERHEQIMARIDRHIARTDRLMERLSAIALDHASRIEEEGDQPNG